jgi:membrane protease YdiL (CAAX protease family)
LTSDPLPSDAADLPLDGGASDGLSQGLPPGLSQGLPPGLSQGLPPGLSQGLSPGQRRFVALGEILLCSSLPTQLSIQVLMQALGWSFEPIPTLSVLTILSMGDTVLLIAIMVILTRAHGESVRELWLGNRGPVGETILGLLLVPPVFLIVGVLMTVLMRFVPVLHNVPTNPLEELATNGPQDAALLGIVAILAGGVREELQRAFLLRRFERHLGGAVVGVIVLSTAFGLGHLLQGRDAAVTTGVLGAFWAIVYLRRRSSIAPMVSHSGFNALEVLRVAILSR